VLLGAPFPTFFANQCQLPVRTVDPGDADVARGATKGFVISVHSQFRAQLCVAYFVGSKSFGNTSKQKHGNVLKLIA
jgi:hypothetical protein